MGKGSGTATCRMPMSFGTSPLAPSSVTTAPLPLDLLQAQRGRSRSPATYKDALEACFDSPNSYEIIKSHPHPLTDPAYFADLHDGFSRDGLTVRTESCEYVLSFLHFSGSVCDRRGIPVGRVGYQSSLDEKEEIGLRLSMFTLEPEYRGTDFSAAYNQHLDETYRREGADYMTLHASGLGSYVWAKQGFLFDSAMMPEPSVTEGLKLAASAKIERGIHIAERTYPQQITPQLCRLFQARLQHSDELTPGALSQFGREASFDTPDGEMWLGKCAFLHGDWHGIKFF